MVLRYYQLEALQACMKSKNGGLVVCPTGSGKSHIIAALCEYFKNLKVLVITPRVELMVQNSLKISTDALCMTVNKAYRSDISCDILIIDECHLVRKFDGMYQTLISKSDKVFGFTATPFRLDCGPLSPQIFKDVLYKIERKKLVKDGFLSPRKFIKMNPDILLNVRNGVLHNTKEISKDVTPKSDKCIIDFLKRSDSKKQALIFVCNVEHSNKIQPLLPQSKIVTSKTPKIERTKIINEFKTGKLQYLINCEILTIGFDYPSLEQLVILRPTDSFSLYEQILGRGDRISPNKICTLIYDYTINVFNFSPRSKKLNDSRYCIYCFKLIDYRLNKCPYCLKKIVKGEVPQKKCTHCKALNFNCAVYCVECGTFIKGNIRYITTNNYKYKNNIFYIEHIKIKTNKKAAYELINYLKSKTYTFYYKWDSYHSSYKLIKISKI